MTITTMLHIVSQVVSVRSSDFRIQQLKLNLNLVLLSIGTCKKLLSTVPGINCYQDLDPMM